MNIRRIVNGSLRQDSERGAALLELALLLPLLAVLAFGVIDLGRLIHARLVVTNVTREGGSLASRDIQTPSNLITMLQSSATPFNLQTQGRIYVTKIKAGTTQSNSSPYIGSRDSGGSYSAGSSIGGNVGQTPTGLPPALFDHLRFESAPQNTSDISEVTVVEVFYHYRPITPLPSFIQNLFPVNGGIVIGSRAIF